MTTNALDAKAQTISGAKTSDGWRVKYTPEEPPVTLYHDPQGTIYCEADADESADLLVQRKSGAPVRLRLVTDTNEARRHTENPTMTTKTNRASTRKGSNHATATAVTKAFNAEYNKAALQELTDKQLLSMSVKACGEFTKAATIVVARLMIRQRNASDKTMTERLRALFPKADLKAWFVVVHRLKMDLTPLKDAAPKPKGAVKKVTTKKTKATKRAVKKSTTKASAKRRK